MKKDILFIVCMILFIFALTGCTTGGKILPNQLYEIFQSGDFTANNWVRGGAILPMMQSEFVQKGKYAVEFPSPGRQQTSFMYIDLDIEEDMVISFYVKTNFPQDGGALFFYVDDTYAGRWMGVNDWKRVIRELPAGEHRLKWELYMDVNAQSDDTRVWLDNIMISKFIPLGEKIVFNDDVFKNYVRRWIGKFSGNSDSRYSADEVYANEVKDIGLIVIYSDVTDITGLEHFTNLKIINAYAKALTDISPMANLQNIEEVDFDEMAVNDISPLDTSAKSGSLKSLVFEGLPLSQASLDIMKTWDQIENLTMDDISLGTLDFLPSGDKLVRLIVKFAELTNIDGLADKTNLTHLDLFFNEIEDLSPLSNLTQLRTLDLRHNPITDLSPLSNMAELTELKFYNSYVSDLNPIATLLKLERLDAANNQIADLTSLENLLALTHLDLQSNAITDITPIVQGPINSLERIYIQNNYLDLTQGSQDMINIQTLINAGIQVNYQPQK